MKIKKKNTSVESLREQVDRKTLELELQALESISNITIGNHELVSPLEPYFDSNDGTRWIDLGMKLSNEESETPYRTEAELKAIRIVSRYNATENPFAINLLRVLQTYIVGNGFTYSPVVKQDTVDEDRAEELVPIVSLWLKRLLQRNKWVKKSKSNLWKTHRDGEVLIRLFYRSNGMTDFRTLDIRSLSTGEDTRENVKYGVVYDEEDGEQVIGYIINGEEVSAEEVQHRKVNTAPEFPRGLSSLYSIRNNLDRAMKLLRNMSNTVSAQAAIAMVRKMQGSSTAVQSFVNAKTTTTIENPVTGYTEKLEKLPGGGAVINAKKGIEYDFPTAGLDPAKPVDCLRAEIRAIAASQDLPEFMVGSDASNANYSSTLVAESPATKRFQSEQGDLEEYDLDLLNAAMEHAIDTGRLPRDTANHIEISVEPPTLVIRDSKEESDENKTYNEMGVKSKQTISSELGLDYEQEQMNFAAEADAAFDDSDLDLDLDTAAGNVTSPGNEESALLSMAAGITGMNEILGRLTAKSITRETAIQLMMLFYKISRERADNLIDKSDTMKPPVEEVK